MAMEDGWAVMELRWRECSGQGQLGQRGLAMVDVVSDDSMNGSYYSGYEDNDDGDDDGNPDNPESIKHLYHIITWKKLSIHFLQDRRNLLGVQNQPGISLDFPSS
jgi:hypothetical protein